MLWRTDHEILIHDGEINIRICPTTPVLTSDNSPVREFFFDSNIKQNENARILLRLQTDSFEADVADVVGHLKTSQCILAFSFDILL